MQPAATLALLAAGFVALAQPAHADLGAALRRSGGPDAAAAALPAAPPMAGGAVVVHLERAAARSSLLGAEGASFYVGRVTIGHPAQELSVLFDTASGHVLLPHRACGSPACVEHRRYSPWESSTAMDVNVDGKAVEAGQRLARGNGTRDGATIGFTQSDLGAGDAKAVLVRDSLCVGGAEEGRACVDLAVLAATSLEDAPFRAMPSDGIVGLGLESLAASPICSFVGRLLEGSRNVLPQFGIALGAERGEVYFGGHDLARLAAPLRWFPVDHPEEGYWQVAIQAVRVGGKVVDDCRRGCHGVVDTAVSRLGVQTSVLPALREALSSALTSHGVCAGPELTFDLGGMALTLQPRDYAGVDCAPQLGPLDLEEPKFRGVYAFGATVLRRYYAAFDWEQRRLGFAPLAGAGEDLLDSATAAPAAAAAGEALLPSDLEALLLV